MRNQSPLAYLMKLHKTGLKLLSTEYDTFLLHINTILNRFHKTVVDDWIEMWPEYSA